MAALNNEVSPIKMRRYGIVSIFPGGLLPHNSQLNFSDLIFDTFKFSGS
jgi:hypothetical protein